MSFLQNELARTRRQRTRSVQELRESKRDLVTALDELNDALRCLKHATTTDLRQMLRAYIRDSREQIAGLRDDIRDLQSDINMRERDIASILKEMK